MAATTFLCVLVVFSLAANVRGQGGCSGVLAGTCPSSVTSGSNYYKTMAGTKATNFVATIKSTTATGCCDSCSTNTACYAWSFQKSSSTSTTGSCTLLSNCTLTTATASNLYSFGVKLYSSTSGGVPSPPPPSPSPPPPSPSPPPPSPSPPPPPVVEVPGVYQCPLTIPRLSSCPDPSATADSLLLVAGVYHAELINTDVSGSPSQYNNMLWYAVSAEECCNKLAYYTGGSGFWSWIPVTNTDTYGNCAIFWESACNIQNSDVNGFVWDNRRQYSRTALVSIPPL